MRVLAVSVAPLFRDFVMGGSQRILTDVAVALGEAGHDVRVLCTRRPENEGGFSLGPKARVEPDLLLRGAFPSPYEVAPFMLSQTVVRLQEAAGWADRIYLHADAMFMRQVFGDAPLVRSLHDFVYEEALLSAFSLPAALTIVPSRYLEECIEASASASAGPTGPVRVVPNGIRRADNPVHPSPPQGVVPREPGDLVLLFPHRLDPRKGLIEALEITALLGSKRPDRRVRLLAPGYPAGASFDDSAASRDHVVAMARERGVESAVEVHGWVPHEQMASYYAFGDVTLCPGNFIEAFGLVPLESVAAGTPAICARVGAFRELEGFPGISHVAYGDVEAAADAVEAAIDGLLDEAVASAAIDERYSHRRMLDGYIEAITGPVATPEAALGSAGADGYVLAPWCHLEGDRIYNDYLYGYRDMPDLARHLATLPPSGLIPAGAERPVPGLDAALADGILVPARRR
ncbi:MAG: glycosyltransferase family 4 protein [Dehalococcoidia bacterium]